MNVSRVDSQKKKTSELSVNYGDEFFRRCIHWFSRSKLTLESNEVKAILAAEQTGLDIHLFTKKTTAKGLTSTTWVQLLLPKAALKKKRCSIKMARKFP